MALNGATSSQESTANLLALGLWLKYLLFCTVLNENSICKHDILLVQVYKAWLNPDEVLISEEERQTPPWQGIQNQVKRYVPYSLG